MMMDQQLSIDNEQDFCATTSAHGLPRLAAATELRNRIVWTIIFVACFVAFIYQAYEIVSKFRRKEKIVNVEVIRVAC
jgi:hypothetical protein